MQTRCPGSRGLPDFYGTREDRASQEAESIAIMGRALNLDATFLDATFLDATFLDATFLDATFLDAAAVRGPFTNEELAGRAGAGQMSGWVSSRLGAPGN